MAATLVAPAENHDGSPTLAWVSIFPAHYTRRLLRAASLEFGDRLRCFFIRLEDDIRQRDYEQSEPLPEGGQAYAEGPVAAVRLLRGLRRYRPDGLLVAGHSPRVVLAAALWGLLSARPVYYMSDTNLFDVMKKPLGMKWGQQFFMRLYLGKMRALLAIGSANRLYYSWVQGGRKNWPPIWHFPYAHSPEYFENRDDRAVALWRAATGTHGRPMVLCLGRLVPEKRHDLVIRGLALLKPDSQEGAKLVVGGESPMRRSLEELAHNLGIGASVSFLGPIRSEEAPSLVQACDVLVVSSAFEPWGLVVNEALSAGKPVVATWRVGAAYDLVRDKGTGILLEQGTPDEIAHALETLLASSSLRERMGERGRELVRTGWTLSASLETLRRVMKDLEAARGCRLPRGRRGKV